MNSFNGETGFDLARMRQDFPALESGLALFDAPGGTQVPSPVAEAIFRTSLAPLSNRNPISLPGQNAERAVTNFRQAVADFTSADPRGVVHGRSASQLIMDFARELSKDWVVGDNIVVSRLDHDANVAPWLIAAKNVGAEVRFADFDPQTSELASEQYQHLVDDRTRIVAVTGASNFVGTKPDVQRIAEIAHTKNAYVFVDAVHMAAHVAIDFGALGADFVVFSPYKIFGPHLGVLLADPLTLEEIVPDKLRPSPNEVPERFELGTLPYEQLAGVTAMVDYIASFGFGSTRRERVVSAMHAFDVHELRLRRLIEVETADISGLNLLSMAQDRTSTLLFQHDSFDPLSIEKRFALQDVIVQAGHFYAQEACEVLQLGAGEGLRGGLRVGLAPYNDDSDVARLIAAFKRL